MIPLKVDHGPWRRSKSVRMKQQVTTDPQSAFRAGLRGQAFLPAAGLAEPAAPWAGGPNEQMVLATGRLPGLTDARAAFETGRALRLVARLFDQAGASARIGEQFRDNLIAAVIGHGTRRTGKPWGAADTIEMFMEMYGRVFGDADAAAIRVRDRLLRWAREDQALPFTTPPPNNTGIGAAA